MCNMIVSKQNHYWFFFRLFSFTYWSTYKFTPFLVVADKINDFASMNCLSKSPWSGVLNGWRCSTVMRNQSFSLLIISFKWISHLRSDMNCTCCSSFKTSVRICVLDVVALVFRLHLSVACQRSSSVDGILFEQNGRKEIVEIDNDVAVHTLHRCCGDRNREDVLHVYVTVTVTFTLNTTINRCQWCETICKLRCVDVLFFPHCFKDQTRESPARHTTTMVDNE